MKIPTMLEDVSSIEVEQEYKPLNPNWVINGQPKSRSKTLSSTKDRAFNVLLWECTAGSFNWHYEKDEVIFILSGEAWITDGEGRERHVGGGDYVFFPAGATCGLRVDSHLRKIAFLRETMSVPHGVALKVWNKLRRIASPFGNPADVPRDSSSDVRLSPARIGGATSLR
jgi:uncharacterized protein